jgi:hypothetical protein
MASPDRSGILGPGPHWRSVLLKGKKVASTTPCCDTEVHVPVRDMEVLGEITVSCPDDGKLWLFRWDPWQPWAQGAWIN